MKPAMMTLLTVAFSVCAVPAAQAHHSHPTFYDQCKSITVEGRVETVQWIDPHVIIVLRLDGGTAHTVDWMALNSIRQRGALGPAQAALVPGARIAVTGNPIRSTAEIRERFPEYPREANPNTVDGMLIRRVDDSWSLARTSSDSMPPSAPPSCAGPTGK